MSTRPSPKAIAWSLFGAVVGLWLSYAVVAGSQTTKAAPVAKAHHAAEAAPVSLALTAAPAIKVRSTLFTGAPAVTVAKPRHRTRRATKRVQTVMRPAAPAAPVMTAPEPDPQSTMTNPVTPTQSSQPATPARSTPAPRPQSKPVSKVSSPAKPDFDDSAPSGFDNSG